MTMERAAKQNGASFVKSLLNAWSWLFLVLILGFFEIYP